MAKVVVIDGLARSGTTLISSILHSQKRSACYRGVFHEFLACNIGKWPLDYASFPHQDQTEVNVASGYKARVENALGLSKLLNDHQRGLKLNYFSLKKHTLNTLKKRAQFDKIALDEWLDLLDSFRPTSLSQLDKMYQHLAKKMDVDVLAFRWNQALPYMKKWLRNQNHYWVSVVRNPMDRALSAKKAFNWTYDESIKASLDFSEKLISHLAVKNHHVIYFEDLLAEPETEVLKLYEFLGVKVDNVNFQLRQQSGKPYVVETSDLVSEGKKHTDGVDYNGFDKSVIDKYKSQMTEDEIRLFLEALSNNAIYNRYL
jgi:ethanolamine utilization protein EutQ (cupin superfamily)